MAARKTIVWTGPALDDLARIKEHVERFDPRAARALGARLEESVQRLREHPLSGRIVPECASRRLREVIVAPYRIVYAVKDGKVLVLRVWHGRRDLIRGETDR
jgi:addiction module RelE/StbE family toxin